MALQRLNVEQSGALDQVVQLVHGFPVVHMFVVLDHSSSSLQSSHLKFTQFADEQQKARMWLSHADTRHSTVALMSQFIQRHRVTSHYIAQNTEWIPSMNSLVCIKRRQGIQFTVESICHTTYPTLTLHKITLRMEFNQIKRPEILLNSVVQ